MQALGRRPTFASTLVASADGNTRPARSKQAKRLGIWRGNALTEEDAAFVAPLLRWAKRLQNTRMPCTQMKKYRCAASTVQARPPLAAPYSPAYRRRPGFDYPATQRCRNRARAPQSPETDVFVSLISHANFRVGCAAAKPNASCKIARRDPRSASSQFQTGGVTPPPFPLIFAITVHEAAHAYVAQINMVIMSARMLVDYH